MADSGRKTTDHAPRKRGRPRTGPDPHRAREILEAAADVFVARGYDATSMQDIADAVDLRKGSVYYYYKSKEDLLYGIIEPFFVAAHDAVAEFGEADGDALDRLTGFVCAHARLATENLRAARIRMRESGQLSARRRNKLKKHADQYYLVLIAILEDGVRQGLIDPTLDLRLTAVTVVGQLNSITQWYSPRGESGPDEIAGHCASLILASVSSDEALARFGGVEELRRHYRVPSKATVPPGV